MQTSNAIYLKLALLRRVAKYDLFLIIYPVYWNVQTFSLTFQLARSLFIGLIDNKLCGCQNFSIIIYSLGGKRNQTVVSIMKLFPSLVLSKLHSGGYNSWKLQQTIGHFECILNRVPALIMIRAVNGKLCTWNKQTKLCAGSSTSIYLCYLWIIQRRFQLFWLYIYRQKIGLSWRTDTTLHRLTHPTSVLLRYFTRCKLQVNIYKTEAILFTRRRPVPPAPLHIQHTVIPWNTQVRYLGLLLDSKLLFTRHLTSVIHKATGIFLQIFPLLARDSTLSIPNKLTLYKPRIRPILTYAAPVWSNTSSYNYRRLQISQSKCLRIIGNYPRRTRIRRLHTTLNVTPIRDFIYHLTANFFDRCPAHPNPIVRSIGNYSLADLLHQYKKYIHKHPKHILL